MPVIICLDLHRSNWKNNPELHSIISPQSRLHHLLSLLGPAFVHISIHAVIYFTPLKFLPTVFSSDVQSWISKDLFLIEDASGRRRYISRNCETWPIDKQGSAARCIFFPKIINALLYFSLIYRRTWRSASPGPTFNPLLTVCPHLSMSSLVPIIKSIFTPAPLLCSHSQAQLWDNDSVETGKLSDGQKCATTVWLPPLMPSSYV